MSAALRFIWTYLNFDLSEVISFLYQVRKRETIEKDK